MKSNLTIQIFLGAITLKEAIAINLNNHHRSRYRSSMPDWMYGGEVPTRAPYYGEEFLKEYNEQEGLNADEFNRATMKHYREYFVDPDDMKSRAEISKESRQR